MERPAVSVIVPVHNEAGRLARSMKKLEGELAAILADFEIIISEDGSTDGTREMAESLSSSRIRVLHRDSRQGKGAAIRTAAAHARGDIVMFMDADLASHPSHVRELVRHLEEGAAIVVGSRYHPQSKARRTPARYAASRAFNALVRALLGSALQDHQCGFKAFRKDLVVPLMDEVIDRKWFWDTELLVLAQRKGLKVVEIPIEWREMEGSRFSLIRDSYHMARSMLNFKLRRG